uniref:Uncharacterized protein n=1 Tax=Arundo donax TaxID=35708 RepID=A0A0A9HLP9_ARUDO
MHVNGIFQVFTSIQYRISCTIKYLTLTLVKLQKEEKEPKFRYRR